MTIKLSPINEVDILPAIKSPHDVEMLDHATLSQAVRLALSVMTNEQKNTIISAEITKFGSTRTARVTLSEFMEWAAYNRMVGETPC